MRKLKDEWTNLNLQLDAREAEALYWLLMLGDFSESSHLIGISGIQKIIVRLRTRLDNMLYDVAYWDRP